MDKINIKDVIQENREYFEKEPEMDHMNKFLFKLQEQQEEQKTQSIVYTNRWWIGMVASLSLLIGISWFITNQHTSNQEKNMQLGLTAELFEIKSYYNMETNKKLEKLTSCAQKLPNTERLLKATESQILKLDFNAAKIENKLQSASGNNKLEIAYIQSLKAKNDLVSKVYQELCSNSSLLTQ